MLGLFSIFTQTSFYLANSFKKTVAYDAFRLYCDLDWLHGYVYLFDNKLTFFAKVRLFLTTVGLLSGWLRYVKSWKVRPVSL